MVMVPFMEPIQFSRDLSAVGGTISATGFPKRVIRTGLIDRLENSGRASAWLRALRHAWKFRKLTGVSFWSLLRAGKSMHGSGELSWSQIAMAANAPMLTRAALVEGKPEVGVLPTGQAVGVIDELPTVAELVARIIGEADEALARLQPPPVSSKERAHG